MADPAAPPFRRDRQVWTVYLVWCWWSYSMAQVGPAIPYLRQQFHMGYALAALHMTVFAGGMVVSGLLAPAALRRVVLMGGMWAGMAGCLVGTALLVLAPSALVSLAAVTVISLFGAISLTACQTWLTARFFQRRAAVLMEATMVTSLGNAAAPFLIALGAATPLGWRIVAPALALFLLLTALLGGSLQRDPNRAEDSRAPEPGGRLPLTYWVFWLLLLTSVAVEWCVGFWSAEYLKDLPGHSLSVAAAGTGVYQVAAMVSRLVSSRIAGRLNDQRLLVLGIVLVACGFPLFWLRAGVASAFSGLALCGAGIAVFYPLSLSLAVASAGGRMRRANAKIPIAVGLAVGLAPLSLGRLADRTGLPTALAMVPLGLVLMAGLLLLHRLSGRRRVAES